MNEAERLYRIKRAGRFWSGLWANDPKRASMVEDSIRIREDATAKELLVAAGCQDPELLIERARPEIERADRVDKKCSDLVKLEARILRRVAGVLSSRFTEAYRSMGGPQDGDSSPSEFDAEAAARDLLDAAVEVEDEAMQSADEESEEA